MHLRYFLVGLVHCLRYLQVLFFSKNNFKTWSHGTIHIIILLQYFQFSTINSIQTDLYLSLFHHHLLLLFLFFIYIFFSWFPFLSHKEGEEVISHIIVIRGVQPTHQNWPDLTHPYIFFECLGYKFFFDIGSGRVRVIKFQTRPDPPIYLIYII